MNNNFNNSPDTVYSRFTTHHSLKTSAFTLAEGATHIAHWNNSRKIAFTLAEVLITLGIIGVVAALTMPTLIQNHKRQENITRLKKVYSILQQDVELAKVENGDIENWDWNLNLNDFVETYLLKDLKIIKNCKNSTGCWNTKDAIYSISGNTVIDNMKGTQYYKVQLADGSYIAFIKQDNNHLHFYADTNGNKQPDRYGADCYIMTFSKGSYTDYAHNIKKAGLYFFGSGLDRDILLNRADDSCYKNKRGTYCGALFQYDGWKMQPDYKF